MKYLAALILALTATLARADWVSLDNGDRYSGRVQGLQNGVLRLQTDFGALQVPWTRVRALSMDAPLEVTLGDGRRLRARLAASAQGPRLLPADGAEQAVELGQVTAMAPVVAPGLRFSGRINAGANVTRGNTSTSTFHADAEVVARTGVHRLSAGAAVNYGREHGSTTVNDATLGLAYDRFFGPRWYVNSQLNLTRDEFKDLNLRTVLGLGLGYQFLDAPPEKLAVEVGLSYLREDFDDGDDRSRPALRYSLDYARKLYFGSLLFHRHELLGGLEGGGDFLLRTQTGLRIPLQERLTGTLQLNFDYDWQPAPGADPEDLAYLFTLGYTF